MQDYKRIVSYIYAYEDNQKKNNVGFAKLEVKGGVGRLSCQLNSKSSLSDEELEIYFLHIGEFYEGIKIGGSKAKNGQVAAEFGINVNNIQSTGIDLSGVHGLYFRTKTEPYKVFASSWVEEDLRLDRFRTFTGGVEAVEVEAENTEAEAVEGIEEQPILQATVIESEPEEGSEEKDIIKTFFEALEKYEEPEKTEKTEKTDEVRQEELSAEEIENCSDKVQRTPWESLCCRYPKVIAFENNMSCRCLKVGVKDIEAIFGKVFNMAPNTFALRGYVKYGYLLLIENEKDSEGQSCVLGVPGIFNANDNHVAEMCGFKEFRQSKNAGKMNCRFGYWLKEMRF